MIKRFKTLMAVFIVVLAVAAGLLLAGGATRPLAGGDPVPPAPLLHDPDW